MKDAKGHGSAAHQAGVTAVGLTMFHGTNKDFSTFELGKGTTPSSQNGIWMADDPALATGYAQIMARYGGDPLLYRAVVHGNMAKQKQWDDLEKSLPGTQYTYERDKQIVAKLRGAGFDGVRRGNAVFVFDPTKISIINKEKVK